MPSNLLFCAMQLVWKMQQCNLFFIESTCLFEMHLSFSFHPPQQIPFNDNKIND